MLQSALGVRIQDLRKQRGWTQRNLSDAAGISFAQVGKIERGKCNVTLTALVLVVQKMGTTVYALFKGIG